MLITSPAVIVIVTVRAIVVAIIEAGMIPQSTTNNTNIETNNKYSDNSSIYYIHYTQYHCSISIGFSTFIVAIALSIISLQCEIRN